MPVLKVIVDTTYDTEADAMYIKLSDSKPAQSLALNNFLIADLDEKQRLVGIEIISFSKLDKKALKL